MTIVQALLGLILVAWLVSDSQQYGMSKLGPYDGKIEQVYPCEDQGTGRGNFQVSLYLGEPDEDHNRKHLHRGSLSWPFTEGQEPTMEANVYMRRSNNYLLSDKHKGNLYHILTKYANNMYNSLREAIGLDPDGCCIPFGNYTFNDWEIPFDFPIPELEYSFYKVTVSILDDQEVIGCWEVLADVKPKY